MSDSYYKLLILRQYVQFQLKLQNCYHDTARETLQTIHGMADNFYKEKKISKFYYKKLNRELKEYDIMYKCQDIRKKNKNCNHRVNLLNRRQHFVE